MSPSLLLLLRSAEACGPFFPQALLFSSEDVLLSAPRGDMSIALDRLPLGEVVHRFSALDAAEADAVDLAAVLGETHPAVGAVASWRAELAADERANDEARDQDALADPLPGGLPAEFRLYLEGVSARARGDAAAAAAAWRAVLALPPESRRYRGAWAAYMLGDWERAEAEAAAGVDTHGIGAASWGQMARERYRGGDPAGALGLYLQQYAARTDAGSGGALLSVRFAARGVAADPDARALAALDPMLAGAVTAWLMEFHHPETAAAWLDAVEAAPAAEADAPLVGAEQLAWIAYQSGRFDAARRWVELAPDAPEAAWIDARLLMMDGEIDAARERIVAADFPDGEGWGCVWYDRDEWGWVDFQPDALVAAEAGVLATRAGDWAGALGAFLSADRWFDAAWIAERVMTSDELLAWLAERPEVTEGGGEQTTPIDPDDLIAPTPTALVGESIPDLGTVRALAARRLAREERWGDALPLYHPAVRERAEAFLAARSRGGPAGLWEAAQIMRWEGMELVGTELEPDVYWSGGDYELGLEARRAELEGLHAPSADERARIEASRASTARYHYRYLAAEMVAEAVDQMPPDSADAVAMLCRAGSWLKYKDPQAADVYYKAMVNRGWNTALGNLANELRWFPPGCEVSEDLPEDAWSEPGECSAAPAAPGWWIAGFALALVARRRR